MKVLFYEEHTNLGSHRIYIDNLSYWFSLEGIETNLVESYMDFKTSINDYDIIILGKNISDNLLSEAQELKSERTLMGICDTATEKLNKVDFGIMGCNSQWNRAVTINRNCFIFPHIERCFVSRKNHQNKSVINFVYHGNLDHLEQLSDHFIEGLEALSKKYDIKLIVVYNKKLGEWTKNRPDIEIIEFDWSIDLWESQLLEGDIGLVPNCIRISQKDRNRFFKKHKEKAVNKNDWLFRYKETVNNGRALVFHQLGIPVVSDIYPESSHVLSSADTGFMVQTKEAFEIVAEKLCQDYKFRQQISDNAYAEFNRLYDPIKWTRKLINGIQSLRLIK